MTLPQAINFLDAVKELTPDQLSALDTVARHERIATSRQKEHFVLWEHVRTSVEWNDALATYGIDALEDRLSELFVGHGLFKQRTPYYDEYEDVRVLIEMAMYVFILSDIWTPLYNYAHCAKIWDAVVGT